MSMIQALPLQVEREPGTKRSNCPPRRVGRKGPVPGDAQCFPKQDSKEAHARLTCTSHSHSSDLRHQNKNPSRRQGCHSSPRNWNRAILWNINLWNSSLRRPVSGDPACKYMSPLSTGTAGLLNLADRAIMRKRERKSLRLFSWWAGGSQL